MEIWVGILRPGVSWGVVLSQDVGVTGKRQVSKLVFCRIWKSTREPEFGRRASRDGFWEHFGQIF